MLPFADTGDRKGSFFVRDSKLDNRNSRESSSFFLTAGIHRTRGL